MTSSSPWIFPRDPRRVRLRRGAGPQARRPSDRPPRRAALCHLRAPARLSPLALDPAKQRALEESVRQFVTPPGSELPLAAVLLRDGDPADEILAQATASGADLIVLGRTDDEASSAGCWLGHRACGAKADRPVMAVPPKNGPPPSRGCCAPSISATLQPNPDPGWSDRAGPGREAHRALRRQRFTWYEPWPIAGITWAPARGRQPGRSEAPGRGGRAPRPRRHGGGVAGGLRPRPQGDPEGGGRRGGPRRPGRERERRRRQTLLRLHGPARPSRGGLSGAPVRHCAPASALSTDNRYRYRWGFLRGVWE